MFLRGPLQQIRKKQLEEQVTYATSEIARYIREGKIDYSQYGDTPAFPSNTLYLKSLTGDSNTVSLATEAGIIHINLNENAGAAWLTGNNVQITNLQFYIYPNTDPTIIQIDGSSVNNQSVVMLVIDAQRADDPTITTHFQVLTTSRYYAR
jgi:hypothetical protein